MKRAIIVEAKANSGRKNFKDQYSRVLKNILLCQAYDLFSKNINEKDFVITSFYEQKDLISLKFKL